MMWKKKVPSQTLAQETGHIEMPLIQIKKPAEEPSCGDGGKIVDF